MIKLEPSMRIGRGLDRDCYIHPSNPARCIKVTVSGDRSQERCEKNYLERLARRNISWDMLARYYGEVETNLGPGLMFELVRDYDGAIARPLSYYLADEARTPSEDLLIRGLTQLLRYLHDQRIIIRDLKSDNILYQQAARGDGRLVIIDGAGNNELIPFSEMLAVLAKRKVLRKWRDFEARILRKFPCNEAVCRAVRSVEFPRATPISWASWQTQNVAWAILPGLIFT